VVTLGFSTVTVVVAIYIPGLVVISGPAVIGAVSLFSVFARELFTRFYRMGSFIVDARTATLARAEAPEHRARIRAVKTSTRFAPDVSEPALSWWVLAELDQGPTFRIARGSWGEVLPWLNWLRELRIPVEAAGAGGSLLKTSHASISQLGPGSIEFQCKETLGKIIAPILVAWWMLFAAVFTVALMHAPPDARLCAIPLFLFFGVGITIGIKNTVTLYRQSGVFVVDLQSGTVLRNGSLVARREEVRRFAVGNPMLGRVVSARRRLRAFGPHVVMLELTSGRRFNLFRGLPGDVLFAADVLRRQGAAVEQL
jgi:hypothetical protein